MYMYIYMCIYIYKFFENIYIYICFQKFLFNSSSPLLLAQTGEVFSVFFYQREANHRLTHLK